MALRMLLSLEQRLLPFLVGCHVFRHSLNVAEMQEHDAACTRLDLRLQSVETRPAARRIAERISSEEQQAM